MSVDSATAPDLDIDDEQYDSADDEDFQIDAAQDDAEITSSDSDEETAEPASKRPKTGKKEPEQKDKELDSGDEATIKKAKAKKEKKQKGKKSGKVDEEEDDVDFDDEEGGPGGFVRTRAMRMQMCVCPRSFHVAYTINQCLLCYCTAKKSENLSQRSMEQRLMWMRSGRE
jgi:hypothetical protein